MTKQPIYFDYAAATPLDPQVLETMLPYLKDNFYNPSANYTPALEIRQALAAARAKVAHWMGAKSSEIIFTAGGTESNNLAIHGIMRQYTDGNMVTMATEHDSVLVPARRHECREVAVKPDGVIDLADLRNKIDSKTVLASISYANNEIGTVQPMREVSRLIEEIRSQRQTEGNNRPIYLHSDACQAGNYLDLHVARLGIDLMTLDGSKVYGPKQSGCLYVKAGVKLQPLIDGGHQENGLRGGTENVAGSIGFGAALEQAQQMRPEEVNRLAKLRDDFMEQLEEAIPSATINGSRKYRLPNNVHLTIPGQDNERLLMQLDQLGILAGAGSACNASDEDPSHVLRAIGLTDADARASLRFTLGRQTTAADIEYAVKTLAGLVR
jgi:cysteine desulfurase